MTKPLHPPRIKIPQSRRAFVAIERGLRYSTGYACDRHAKEREPRPPQQVSRPRPYQLPRGFKPLAIRCRIAAQDMGYREGDRVPIVNLADATGVEISRVRNCLSHRRDWVFFEQEDLCLYLHDDAASAS